MAEAAFNPDKFIAETQPVAPAQAQAFSPDKFLAETEVDPNKLKGQELLDFMHSGKDQSALGRANMKDLPAAAGQLLDYPGGLMRTGLASVGGLLTGNPNAVTEDDVKKAFVGMAPRSSEYMKRLGVPEGPSMDVPFIGKTTARDAGGFVADMGVDPLSYGSVVGKGFRPLSEAAEGAGKAAYKSGLKKVDERLAERGAKPLSDVLIENGMPTGTTKTIAEEAKNINSASLEARKSLYEKVKEIGEKVDIGGAAKRAKKYLADMIDMDDPGLEEVAKKLQERLDKYTSKGFIDVDKASRWKTNIYNSLPQSAYDQHGRMIPQVQEFMKRLGADFRQAIIDAGEKAQKGLGQEIDKANETMGSIIQAKKPLAMQVRRAETPNLVTTVDGMLAATSAAASHDPIMTAKIMAVKKASDLAKTTYARTKGGKGLVNLGKTGLLDDASRQGLVRLPDNKKGLVNDRAD